MSHKIGCRIMDEIFRKTAKSRCSLWLAIFWAISVLLGSPTAAQAAGAAPLLKKVFVYAGEERIRLVALFDGALVGSSPSSRVKNGGLSMFVRGARGGKPFRRFALGQGGYERIEARQGKDGLWFSVLTKDGVSPLKKIPEITLGKSAITVTLPVLKKGPAMGAVKKKAAGPLAAGGSFKRKKVGSGSGKSFGLKKKAASQITPESIMSRVLSSSPAEAAAPGPIHPSLTKRPIKRAGSQSRRSGEKKDQLSKLLTGGEKGDFLSSLQSGNPPKKLALGSNVASLSGMAMKFAGALGAILILILGGFLFFKKLAPGAVSRLGGNGALVRTLYKSTLAPKKSLALVEVAGEVLVLGISGQSIAMLTKIESEEALARVRAAGESNFVEHLSKMLAKRSEDSEGADIPGIGKISLENEIDKEWKIDIGGSGPPEKSAAALLAYAKQAPLGGGSKQRAGSQAALALPKSPAAGRGGGKNASASGRSAARLRNRLDRVAPKMGTGVAVP
ncbi:FliO/MopB family protein [Nitrospinota bacterium]